MTEIKTQPKLPELVKAQQTYKLIVPENVEEKIRYLLRKFPTTEWSGVLFYNYSGTFENNDLVITCKDIYPMDLGNATFTSFCMNEDVASYLARNMDLFTCDMGLVHSHHTMSTFFSGTDTQTLKEEGNERNCFVSLIVNNAGVYSAAVTRKIQTKTEVTKRSLGTSYQFFGEGTIYKGENSMIETTEEVDATVIEYFMLDVERHEVTNPLDYLDKRFEEIKSKQATAKPIWGNYGATYPSYTPKPVIPSVTKKWEPEEPTLWDKDIMDEMKVAPDGITPDPKLIHKAVVQMVMCSLIIDPDRINFDSWVKNNLDKTYNRTFPGINKIPNKFDEWTEFIVEYMITNFDDPNFRYEEYGEIEYASIVAEAMIDELTPYMEYSEHIAAYIAVLERYLA